MCAAQAAVPDGLGDLSHLHGASDADRESDDVEDLEESVPYSEDFDEWPDAPVMLCPDTAAAHQVRRSPCSWLLRCRWCWARDPDVVSSAPGRTCSTLSVSC